MSELTDYCTAIRRWIDDEDEYSDTIITEWIRDAEERLNNELRSLDQMVRIYATFDDECAALPSDWLEHVYVRLKGGTPFDYITPHDYWALRKNAPPTMIPDPTGGEVYGAGTKMRYTTIGKTLFVWPLVNPEALTEVEVCYFRALTPLGDTRDPLMDRYPSLYRNCTLAAGSPYLIEDERLQTWAGLASASIHAANEAARRARWSGSPLGTKIRGFG